jgi:hypothetical protein
MKPLCPDCGDRHEKYQAHVFPVANNEKPVANTVANKPKTSVEGLRVELWREANRDRYNARQRELMRKRRQKTA